MEDFKFALATGLMTFSTVTGFGTGILVVRLLWQAFP